MYALSRKSLLLLLVNHPESTLPLSTSQMDSNQIRYTKSLVSCYVEPPAATCHVMELTPASPCHVTESTLALRSPSVLPSNSCPRKVGQVIRSHLTHPFHSVEFERDRELLQLTEKTKQTLQNLASLLPRLESHHYSLQQLHSSVVLFFPTNPKGAEPR